LTHQGSRECVTGEAPLFIVGILRQESAGTSNSHAGGAGNEVSVAGAQCSQARNTLSLEAKDDATPHIIRRMAAGQKGFARMNTLNILMAQEDIHFWAMLNAKCSAETV